MSTVLGSVTPARQQVERALSGARRREPAPEHAVLALQRRAGNAAVSALIAGRLRTSGGDAIGRLNAALREIRKDEPAIDTVEKGLRDAKAVGVPVDLEGVKPPPSALAVTTTGFGPGSVAAKKPVPPAKPVPKKNALAKAGSRRTPPKAGAAGGRAPAVGGSVGAVPAPPRVLSPDQLLQPPVPPVGVRPEQDPAFGAVRSSVVRSGTQARAHAPATAKAKEAQDAAVAPTGDIGAQARAAKIDTMDAQQPGTFDKKAFITAVKAAIEAKSPKTLKEADDYKKSGRAGEVKGEVKGLVNQGTEGQAKDIDTATQAAPDESKAVPKPVTPLAPEPVGQVPAVPATGAVPKPAPPEQTNLQAGKAETDREMADANVTESQLQQSNEPEFQQAVTDKKAAAHHADTAPAEFRQQEQQVIQQGKGEAAQSAASAVAGMRGAKAAAVAGLIAGKGKAKSRDEAKRAEVTTRIQGLYAAAEKDVKGILDGIDPKVEAEFGRGEASARAEFENYVAAKMSAYKKDRYGGWLGGLRWAKDKLFGMPEKVNEFYAAGRELYLKRMDGVIERVANIVGGDLGRAKKRIAAGRSEIAAYVKSLPADLKKVGSQTSAEIGEKFEALEGDVAAKQEAAVDLLASKYVESRKGLDERIEALQAENKGLVDKAIGAIKAVINTIRQLAAMLRDVLSRVAGVVGDIIASPVRFLGNLIAGIKGGILKFKDTIVDHLRKGLMSWLFGALAEGGIELPKSFDLKGIIGFLASLFGLTWAKIRARIAKRIGEPAMGAIETGVEIFQKFRAEGVAGLWQMLLDKLGDIKEMILEQVKDFVVTKIIVAGVSWLIGLLNPAAAFIKACKLIYDVVMFFVNNAARIKKFVDTVLDSVADVVRGNVGGVIEKVNNALGQMVPILIGFLASLIGLGGIGQKIRQIVEKLQKPVTKAIDFVIDKGLKLAGPVLRGLKKVSGYVKGKVAAGKAWVKGKADAGKQWVKRKVYGGDDSPEGKQKRLDSAMTRGVEAANRLAGKTVGAHVLKPMLGMVGKRYGVAVLEPVLEGDHWAVHGEIQRTTKTTRVKGSPLPAGHLAPLTLPEEAELTGVIDNDTLFDLVPTVPATYLLQLKRAGAPAAMMKTISTAGGANGFSVVASKLAAPTTAALMAAMAAHPSTPGPVIMDLLESFANHSWPVARLGLFLTAAGAAGVTSMGGLRDLIWMADKFHRFHVGSTDPGGGVAGTSVGSQHIRWRGNEMAEIALHDTDVRHFAARHTVKDFDLGAAKVRNSLFDHTVTADTLQDAVLAGLRKAMVKEAIKELILRTQASGLLTDYAPVGMMVNTGSGVVQVGIRVSATAGIWSGRTVNFHPMSGTTNVSAAEMQAIRALIGK